MKDYLEKRREELRKEQGFTLMEMLIVVAIIAVLIAIAIPVFTSQLEKSRESADAANIRAEYAKVMVAIIEQDTAADIAADDHEIKLQQAQDDWQNTEIGTNLKALETDDGKSKVEVTGTPKANGTATISYTASNGTVTINFPTGA